MHVLRLAVTGFKFCLAPTMAVIHRPHAPSPDLVRFRQCRKYQVCTSKRASIAQEALLQNVAHPDRFRLPLGTHTPSSSGGGVSDKSKGKGDGDTGQARRLSARSAGGAYGRAVGSKLTAKERAQSAAVRRVQRSKEKKRQAP